MEMSRLTRGGTAEPDSRDQTLRHVRGQGNNHFPCSADHEQDWQPHPVDLYSAIQHVMTIHTSIHTYCTYKYPQLVTSKPNLLTLGREFESRISAQSHELGFFLAQKNKHEALCWRQELEGSTPRSGRWPIY